jgi:xanthine dehydrogenase YagS FAD-binding subunit
MLPNFSLIRPTTLDEALQHLGKPRTLIHGGGTDLLGCLRDRVFDADTVVSLGGIDELRGIAATPDGGLSIGALSSIADIASSENIATRYTALAESARAVASPQLRNQGTLGGNLCQKPRCWYYRREFDCLRKGGDECFVVDGENRYHCIFGGESCFIVHPSDTAPALAALGAVCRVSGPSGDRSVAVEKLHVPPSEDPTRETVLEADEIITSIVLPAPAAGLRSSYRKVRERAAWDFALAGVALALRFEGESVAAADVFLSGAAPVPWRSTAVEQAIVGKTLDQSAVAAAAEAVVTGAEPLAQNAYKIPMFAGLITDELERIAASA